MKTSSFELYHFEQTKLSFDDFLMMTSERENESESKRKKEPQIPRPSVTLAKLQKQL